MSERHQPNTSPDGSLASSPPRCVAWVRRAGLMCLLAAWVVGSHGACRPGTPSAPSLVVVFTGASKGMVRPARLPSTVGGGLEGGLPLVAAVVRDLRARYGEDRVLVLDSGGAYGLGSVEARLSGRKIMREFLASVRYDAVALDNRDLDGLEYMSETDLAQHLGPDGPPILAANMLPRSQQDVFSRLLPSSLFSRAGLQVGVVGAVSPALASRTKAPVATRYLVPERPHETASHLNEAAASLREGGAELVVLLASMRQAEVDLVHPLLQGIDLVIRRSGQEGGTRAAGCDPVELLPEQTPPVVSTAGQNRSVGTCEVLPADAGRQVRCREIPVVWPCREGGSGPALRPAEEIAWIYQRFLLPVRRAASSPVTVLLEPLAHAQSRGSELYWRDSPLARAVADSVRARVEAELALVNPGALKRRAPAGLVTRADLLEMAPFDDHVVRLHVKGDELRAILHQGACLARAKQFSPPVPAGFHYRALPSPDEEGRWIHVCIGDDQVCSEDPPDNLEDDQEYAIATTDFLRNGGDGLSRLRDVTREDRFPGRPQFRAAVAAALKGALFRPPAPRHRLSVSALDPDACGTPETGGAP